MSTKAVSWGSRWGFIITALGMSVGTGVMWRFPRVTAEYGGMPFLIVLIGTVFVWVIPILIVESYIGKTTKRGPVAGIIMILKNKKMAWVGTMYAWTCFFLSAYYLVVFGWVLRYLAYAMTGAISPGVDTDLLWHEFSTGSGTMVPWWLMALGLSGGILLCGGIKYVEMISKYAMPLWFILVLGLAIRAITLPGGMAGLEYLFAPDWGEFRNPNMWREAITQAIWQTASGLGMIFCYSIYLKEDDDISLNCAIIPVAVSAAAIICGMAVIPTIFALSPDPQAVLASGNTGLTFIHLSKLFTVIPGGVFLSAIFFFALAIAAYTSSICFVEVTTRVIQDTGMGRKKAIIVAMLILGVLGFPSALDINILNNQDWVYGLGIPLNGFIILLIAIKLNPQKIWNEHIAPCSDLDIPIVMKFIYVMPAVFILMIGMWIYSAVVGYPGEWMKWLPVSDYTYTVGTVLYQWAFALIISLLTSNYIGRIMKNDVPTHIE